MGYELTRVEKKGHVTILLISGQINSEAMRILPGWMPVEHPQNGRGYSGSLFQVFR